jgi:hypothetical protein
LKCCQIESCHNKCCNKNVATTNFATTNVATTNVATTNVATKTFQQHYNIRVNIRTDVVRINVVRINVISTIRKEFLSRINEVYYWRYFCTTHEHYNYLQLMKLIKNGNTYAKDN